MTCKHPKSSRYIERLVDYVSDRTGRRFVLPEEAAVSMMIRGLGMVAKENEYIRTICADCGKVLKEVKVIEK